MDVYEIKFTENHKVSLVKDPAIEKTLIKFSNETSEVLHFTNDEKKIVYSVAMIPNKMIFRKDVKGKPANVFYSAETIEKFQQDYFRTNANSGTNINHQSFNTDGIFPFESWIVSDDNRAELLGLDAPKGSLVMGFKIDNPEVWNEIKAGNLDGLSVEGNVIFEQQTNITMTKEKILTAFEAFKKALFADEKTPEEIKAEEDAIALKMAEEEALKNATPPTEPPTNDDDPDYEEENKKLKEQVVLLEEKLSMMEADKVKSETDLVTMKAEKEKAIADLITFKNETPASEPIQNVPSKIEMQKDFEKMTPLEKFRASK
jgi:hypothetical protein